MLCEMCSKAGACLKVDVEGARLSVCEACSKYGKLIARLASSPARKDAKKLLEKKNALKASETLQLIKPGSAGIVKNAREKLGLTQADLARKLMERESVVHNIESGHLIPSIELARKLEKALRVSIVEQVEVESGSRIPSSKGSAGGLTIGDLIGVK